MVKLRKIFKAVFFFFYLILKKVKYSAKLKVEGY